MPKLVDGIWRPSEDLHGVNAALEHVKDLEEAIKFCSKRNVAIQAGGNCGIFPCYLANNFKVVYTFEPENENFFCLVNNATAGNIIKFQAAIGCSGSLPVGLIYDPKNAGGHYVRTGNGILPVISVDSLNLPTCDLLQFDIEGYELFALKGAAETIKKYSPVIMIEHKKHAQRYGAEPGDVIQFLTDIGYEKKQEVRRDLIFTRGE